MKGHCQCREGWRVYRVDQNGDQYGAPCVCLKGTLLRTRLAKRP